MSAPAVNLETLQKALGYRFGNHQLLKSALVGDKWLAEVGRAAVVSSLCEFGEDRVHRCLSKESLSRVSAKLAVECDVFCLFGAIRMDISHKKTIRRIEEVFAQLFDLPSQDGNREFVQFHNVLNNGSAGDLERSLNVNKELVHVHTKNGGNTALMLVINRRIRRGVPHRFRLIGPNLMFSFDLVPIGTCKTPRVSLLRR